MNDDSWLTDASYNEGRVVLFTGSVSGVRTTEHIKKLYRGLKVGFIIGAVKNRQNNIIIYKINV